MPLGYSSVNYCVGCTEFCVGCKTLVLLPFFLSDLHVRLISGWTSELGILDYQHCHQLFIHLRTAIIDSLGLIETIFLIYSSILLLLLSVYRSFYNYTNQIQAELLHNSKKARVFSHRTGFQSDIWHSRFFGKNNIWRP